MEQEEKNRSQRKNSRQKKEERRKQHVRNQWLAMVGICLLTLLGACGIEQTSRTKVKDLDYTIVAEEEIPETLKEKIEEKKAADFKMTYTDEAFLYIVRGYGECETGGYSICVRELYLTSNAVLVYTELLGPRKGESISKSPSYPFIVIKTEKRDENVIFE